MRPAEFLLLAGLCLAVVAWGVCSPQKAKADDGYTLPARGQGVGGVPVLWGSGGAALPVRAAADDPGSGVVSSPPETYPAEYQPTRWLRFQAESPAIVKCESHGDPNAFNPVSGTVGIYQLAPVHRARAERLGWTWAQVSHEALANTAVAFSLWLDGEDWHQWACR